MPQMTYDTVNTLSKDKVKGKGDKKLKDALMKTKFGKKC